MITIPELILKDVQDPWIRENFKRISEYMLRDPLGRAIWRFREIEFVSAQTNAKVHHGCGFKPLDIIQTSSIGVGTVTYNFGLFDDETLDITSTGACTVRLFIGAYRDGKSL